jgi:hypothetical protein
MSVLATLVEANIRNSYRNKAVLAVMLGFAAFFIALFVAIVCALAIIPLARSPVPDRVEASRYLALIAYGSGFLAIGLNLVIFTSNILAKEKAQRIFETQLAAPVGARELWLGKTLAIFLPGLALCEAASLGSLLGVDALIIAPRMGFLASPAMLASSLALAPILFFPLCCLVTLVGLTGNPVSANVIANVAFSVLIALAINLVTRAGLDVASPAFAIGNLALAAALTLAVMALRPRLSKERIVLSCRS